jgi:hypothetical protein
MRPVFRQLRAEIKFNLRASQQLALKCPALNMHTQYLPRDVARVIADALQGFENERTFERDIELPWILHGSSEESA